MAWCFAIINNRLGEIYFEEKKNRQIKFWGHCYIKRTDFKIKQEQKWIDQDIKKTRIIYRGGKYKVIPPKEIEHRGNAYKK